MSQSITNIITYDKYYSKQYTVSLYSQHNIQPVFIIVSFPKIFNSISLPIFQYVKPFNFVYPLLITGFHRFSSKMALHKPKGSTLDLRKNMMHFLSHYLASKALRKFRLFYRIIDRGVLCVATCS